MSQRGHKAFLRNWFSDYLALTLLIAFVSFSCQTRKEKIVQPARSDLAPINDKQKLADTILSARSVNEQVHALKLVPVLCYHQVRDWNGGDSKFERTYIVPVARFKEQMQMLNDSGFHTILPAQLVAYVEKGERLPEKPVLITFDDGSVSQYDNALPELQKHGFIATFFIMTVALNRKDYLSIEQVKELVKQGHTIGCHTWDHHSVTRYKSTDWLVQVKKPTVELEHITGGQIAYFAYPFGLWNASAVDELKKYGFIIAFQLWGKTDEEQPLFTVRRMIADGNWDAAQLSSAIKRNYDR